MQEVGRWKSFDYAVLLAEVLEVKISVLLVMLPSFGYLSYTSLHNLDIFGQIWTDLISDPDSSFSRRKSSSCVVIWRDESFDVCIKSMSYNSQCFVTSWEKEPTARQPRVLMRIWAIRILFSVMPSQEGGRTIGNSSLEICSWIPKETTRIKNLLMVDMCKVTGFSPIPREMIKP